MIRCSLKQILDSRPYYLKIVNGKFKTLGMPRVFEVLSPNMAGIRNFAFFVFCQASLLSPQC